MTEIENIHALLKSRGELYRRIDKAKRLMRKAARKLYLTNAVSSEGMELLEKAIKVLAARK